MISLGYVNSSDRAAYWNCTPGIDKLATMQQQQEEEEEDGKSKLINPLVLLLIYESFKCLVTIICILLRCNVCVCACDDVDVDALSLRFTHFKEMWWKVNIIVVAVLHNFIRIS